MESLAITTTSVSTSMTSPRWPSARLASFRAPSLRDQREMSSRAPGASTVAAAASHPQYASASLPPLFKGSATRQLQPSTAGASGAQAASWSVQSNLRSLIQTRCNDLSLDAFIRDPIAWLMNLVYSLQSMLARLFTGSAPPSRNSTGFYASTAASSSQAKSSATAAAPCEPVTRRCSSGRYVPPISGRQATEPAQTTRLVATQQMSPAPAGQRSPVPVAALAVAAAASLAFGGIWLFRRWRAMVEVQREQAQRAAVKKDSLARQKQRFQRALVVDSVNLELPPIKDMDVQPGPVRVEKIISQVSSSQQQRDVSATSAPQRSGTVPGLAGESLRQWQQFMAASRAKEVTNVSGSQRGSRGAAEPPTDRPYSMALDDRMLADLSERIRRANDLSAAGEAPPPMPVITFEQLYANNQESDDEAMARRAAERKARWQKQHPTASVGDAAPPGSTAAGRPPPGPHKKPPTASGSKTATVPSSKPVAAAASKPRPKAPIADNPFAVGIVASSSAAAPPSSVSPPTALASSSNTDARGGAQPDEPSASRPSPARPEAPASASSSSPGGRVSARNPFMKPPTMASTTHADTPQPSGRDGGAGIPPANRASWRTSIEQGAARVQRKSASASTPLPSEPAPVSTPLPTEAALASLPAPKEESPTPKEAERPTLPVPIDDVPSCSIAGESSNGRDLDGACQLITSASDSCRQDSTPLVSQDADSKSPRRETDELVASPGRIKRQPAIGQLRTPETQAPALKRLMRRPSGAAVTSDEPRPSRATVPDLQLSESAP